MEKTFEGFTAPTKNYFHMPNNWTDITAEIDNLAELKVVEYVLRHTWGYKEYGVSKVISVDEFMKGRRRQDGSRIDKGTGLKSDRSVKDALKLAIQHGYLLCDVDASDLGRTKKSYRLNMIDTGVETTPQVEATPGVDNVGQGGSNYLSGVQHLPPRGTTSTPRTEKDTIRKTPKKDTIESRTDQPELLSASKGKLVITLSSTEQAVFDEWAKMPWFKSVPDLQTNDPNHLRKLAPYQPTAETMLKCKNWATSSQVDKNGWYKRTGWSLYGLAKEYPRWLSTQMEDTGPATPPQNVIIRPKGSVNRFDRPAIKTGTEAR